MAQRPLSGHSRAASSRSGRHGSQLLLPTGSLSARQRSLEAPSEASLSEYGAIGATPQSARQHSVRGVDRTADAALSKKEFEARRKRQETAVKHERLTNLREQDARIMRERAARVVADREQRFEAMMDSLKSDDNMRVKAAGIIRQAEHDQMKKKFDLYQTWDNQVMRRVDAHLMEFMTDDPPEHEEGWRKELRKSDCPLKQAVRDFHGEDQFHREASSLLQDTAMDEIAEVGLAEHVRRRDHHASLVKNRDHSRPTLPVEMWAQQHHYASRFGYFAQGSERAEHGELGFRSARRQGVDAHLPDERDGVPLAGKSKHRHERNLLGALTGTTAKYGESYRHKASHGPGSAAPLQDHYTYEKGTAIVDHEFPIGKRCYPHMKNF